MTYRVKLNTFEGPFDLLVYLIEHAEMSIYDIRISEIVDQYIDHIEEMKEADISVSSDFLVLASELLEIKSRLLLPRMVTDSSGKTVEEDPRSELVERLLEYKKFRKCAEILEKRREYASAGLEKPQEELEAYTREGAVELDLDLKKFRSAFEAFLRRKKKLKEIRHHHQRSEKQKMTAEMRMKDIRELFRRDPGLEADFRELVKDGEDMYDVALTFSSVLEMMKERRLDAEQERIYGDITVRAAEDMFKEEDDGGKQDH